MTPRQKALVLSLFVASLLSGCFGASGPSPTPPADAQSLPVLPYEHRLTLSADLSAGSWHLWLWKNAIPPSERDDDVPWAREVRAEPVEGGNEPFWLGAYWINVAQDASTGQPLFMSERAPAQLMMVSNEWLSTGDNAVLLGKQEGAFAPRLHDLEGVLVFSEAPVRITYDLVRGAGLKHDLMPVATGEDLWVRTLAPQASTALSAGERTVNATSQGFITGAMAADLYPPFVGAAEYRYDLAFPDGDRRTRDFKFQNSKLEPSRCYPHTDGSASCRKAGGGGITFMDMVNSCQPRGEARATVAVQTPNPTVRPTPVLIGVPFDYCKLLGTDADTPHPCVDMTTTDYRGCPP